MITQEDLDTEVLAEDRDDLLPSPADLSDLPDDLGFDFGEPDEELVIEESSEP